MISGTLSPPFYLLLLSIFSPFSNVKLQLSSCCASPFATYQDVITSCDLDLSFPCSTLPHRTWANVCVCSSNTPKEPWPFTLTCSRNWEPHNSYFQAVVFVLCQEKWQLEGATTNWIDTIFWPFYSSWLGSKFSANSSGFLFLFPRMDNNLEAHLGVEPCPAGSSSCPPIHDPLSSTCVLQLFPRLNERSTWLLIFLFLIVETSRNTFPF